MDREAIDMPTFKIEMYATLSGATVEITADSEHEAMELFERHQWSKAPNYMEAKLLGAKIGRVIRPAETDLVRPEE
jgi:hypothetical protein